MHDRDCLHRFMFEHFPIRGHLVHLDSAWHALIEHHDYPALIRDILGETVAASLLLAGTIKFDGVLSLQLQGDGPVQLMLAQCTSGLGVRGLARHRAGSSPAGGIGDSQEPVGRQAVLQGGQAIVAGGARRCDLGELADRDGELGRRIQNADQIAVRQLGLTQGQAPHLVLPLGVHFDLRVNMRGQDRQHTAGD